MKLHLAIDLLSPTSEPSKIFTDLGVLPPELVRRRFTYNFPSNRKLCIDYLFVDVGRGVHVLEGM